MADGSEIVLKKRAEGANRSQNVRAVQANGSGIWRALLPESSGPDAFVSLQVEGRAIIARPRSGWSLQPDPASGVTLGADVAT